jgi:hypothetical protein
VECYRSCAYQRDRSQTSDKAQPEVSVVSQCTLETVEDDSSNVALPEYPEQVKDQFLLQQWREIEEMLVERGATDTGITTLEP